MIITVLFPELIVVHAIVEFSMALQALRGFERAGRPVDLPWWLKRPSLSSSALRLSIPWKCVACPTQQNKTDNESQSADDRERTAESELRSVDQRLDTAGSGSHSLHRYDRKWTLVHCYFANMGGFYCKGKRYDQRFPLTALQMVEVPNFESPQVTEEEIADKSKRDWFAKIIAALGFLQLVLSLIVRTSQGLAFSQLETITLGFAVCGAMIYLLYLYKPQQVETGIPVERYVDGRRDAPLEFRKTYDSLWDVLTNESAHDDTTQDSDDRNSKVPERIPNDNIPDIREPHHPSGCVPFGICIGPLWCHARHSLAFRVSFGRGEDPLADCYCLRRRKPSSWPGHDTVCTVDRFCR